MILLKEKKNKRRRRKRKRLGATRPDRALFKKKIAIGVDDMSFASICFEILFLKDASYGFFYIIGVMMARKTWSMFFDLKFIFQLFFFKKHLEKRPNP